MSLPTIQHAVINLSGFFEWSSEKISQQKFSNKYVYDSYYENNKSYLEQKYYPNWMSIVFPSADHLDKKEFYGLTSTHLLHLDPPGNLVLESTQGSSIPFSIGKIRAFLFKENIGIFSIQVVLAQPDTDFDTISFVSRGLRDITGKVKYTPINPLVNIIDREIMDPLGKEYTDWKRFNPQLKVYLNIDVGGEFANDKEWNSVLLDLATLSNVVVKPAENIYKRTGLYEHQLLRQHTINIYSNWKVLCLYDTLARISINLRDADKYRSWDEEYYIIYIFSLFIRYYLYLANDSLTILPNKNDNKVQIRDAYIKFLNDVDLTQISFKFLPNLIYEKLLLAQQVKEEMNRLDIKLTRIDTNVREAQEKRIGNLLLFFTLFSIFSLLLDGVQLITGFLDIDKNSVDFNYTNSFRLISVILIIFAVAGVYFFYRKKK